MNYNQFAARQSVIDQNHAIQIWPNFGVVWCWWWWNARRREFGKQERDFLNYIHIHAVCA